VLVEEENNMSAPPFGFQQQLDPGLLQQIVEAGKNSGWGPVINKAISGATQGYQQGQQRRDHNQQKQLVQKLAMQMQNMSQPQQGPPAPAGPPIQGPAGYAPQIKALTQRLFRRDRHRCNRIRQAGWVLRRDKIRLS
jgi:hypothetical protein